MEAPKFSAMPRSIIHTAGTWTYMMRATSPISRSGGAQARPRYAPTASMPSPISGSAICITFPMRSSNALDASRLRSDRKQVHAHSTLVDRHDRSAFEICPVTGDDGLEERDQEG